MRAPLEQIAVKLVETPRERQSAIAVRMRVFVEEQSVPASEELDEADATATHAIALCEDRVVGTGRLVARDDRTAQIGRMAVDRTYRNRGIGSLLLKRLEAEARAQGLKRAVLHAQEHANGFYAAHGYREHGGVFLEVNIPHVEMRKEL